MQKDWMEWELQHYFDFYLKKKVQDILIIQPIL